jgi:hypothetical protein
VQNEEKKGGVVLPEASLRETTHLTTMCGVCAVVLWDFCWFLSVVWCYTVYGPVVEPAKLKLIQARVGNGEDGGREGRDEFKVSLDGLGAALVLVCTFAVAVRLELAVIENGIAVHLTGDADGDGLEGVASSAGSGGLSDTGSGGEGSVVGRESTRGVSGVKPTSAARDTETDTNDNHGEHNTDDGRNRVKDNVLGIGVSRVGADESEQADGVDGSGFGHDDSDFPEVGLRVSLDGAVGTPDTVSN